MLSPFHHAAKLLEDTADMSYMSRIGKLDDCILKMIQPQSNVVEASTNWGIRTEHTCADAQTLWLKSSYFYCTAMLRLII